MGTKLRARILIVEDDAITIQALSEVLTEAGHEVVGTASRGWEAVEKSIGLRPDLVIMDIKLRGAMDGIATSQRIQAQLDIPVVYVTAYSDNETLKRVLHSNANGYIVKPFDVYTLQNTVDRALRQRQSRQG